MRLSVKLTYDSTILQVEQDWNNDTKEIVYVSVLVLP